VIGLCQKDSIIGKKALYKFRVHEASQMHRESYIKLNSLKEKSIVAHSSDMKSTDQK